MVTVVLHMVTGYICIDLVTCLHWLQQVTCGYAIDLVTWLHVTSGYTRLHIGYRLLVDLVIRLH